MRTSGQRSTRKPNTENVCKKEGANWFSVLNVCDRLSDLKTENYIPLATGEPLVTLSRAVSVERWGQKTNWRVQEKIRGEKVGERGCG